VEISLVWAATDGSFAGVGDTRVSFTREVTALPRGGNGIQAGEPPDYR